jgi:probable HAF family extracellular repeat protein
MKRLLYGVVAWGVLVGFTGSAKAQYIFTTLDVPGSTDTFASGINASGQIVGYYAVSVNRSHGFLATPVP